MNNIKNDEMNSNHNHSKPSMNSGTRWIKLCIVLIILVSSALWFKIKVNQNEIQFLNHENAMSPNVIVAHQRPPVDKKKQNGYGFDLTQLMIPENEIISGGVRKNGIPALVNPKMILAEKANYLSEKDEIAGLSINGVTQAFPIKILTHHEAVNTIIDDRFIAIVYCPLCKSLVAYDRMINNKEIIFRISGKLFNSNVLLYSEQKSIAPIDSTENNIEPLYSQMMNQQISGKRSGMILETIPVELTTWENWKKRHPETKVMSTDTGYSRNYSSNPYKRYFESDKLVFPVKKRDDRLPQKSLVLGLWTGKYFRAYPVKQFEKMSKSQEIKINLNNKNATIYYDHHSKSLRMLTADKDLNWMYSFWFAWYAFHPETEIFAFTNQ